MPIPDHHWIAIDFGGTSKKVAFPSPDDASVINLSFPTLFHYSPEDASISVAESTFAQLDSTPEGTMLLKKSRISRNKTVSLPIKEISVNVSELLTQFFVHIRLLCEKNYFHGVPIQTCILTLHFPYRSLHRGKCSSIRIVVKKFYRCDNVHR